MDNFDPAGVWLRVHPGTDAVGPQEGLPELIAGELEDATGYALLARQHRENALLPRLREEARAQAACLAGICFLVTGKAPAAAPPPSSSGLPAAALRRCYLRTLNRVREFERRSGDREFGPAFSALAHREREQCRRLLELLGRHALETAGFR